MSVRPQDVLAWLDALQQVYAENKAWLTELDAAIGDADHGINLDRGFTAVKAELARSPSSDIATLFKTVATVLIRTVGGAAGPLYGTFFLRASAACAGKAELQAGDVVAMFQAGAQVFSSAARQNRATRQCSMPGAGRASDAAGASSRGPTCRAFWN